MFNAYVEAYKIIAEAEKNYIREDNVKVREKRYNEFFDEDLVYKRIKESFDSKE